MAREGRQLGLTVAFPNSGVLVYEMAAGGLCQVGQSGSVAPTWLAFWQLGHLLQSKSLLQTFLNPVSLLTPAQLFSGASSLKPTLLME